MLKIGDKVRIKRGSTWYITIAGIGDWSNMRDYENQIGVIIRIYPEGRLNYLIEIPNKPFCYVWPKECVKLIKEINKNEDK